MSEDTESYRSKKSRTSVVKNGKRGDRNGNTNMRSNLDPTLSSYLLNILKTMWKHTEEEERELMADNVLDQLDGKEIRCASDQIGSRVIENLVAYAGVDTLEKLMDAFADNLRAVCNETCASYVLQRMLRVAILRGVALLQQPKADDDGDADGSNVPRKKQFTGGNWNREEVRSDMWKFQEHSLLKEFPDEHRKRCRKFVVRVCKFLLNNLEEFLYDSIASHIVRMCILSLTGITDMKTGDRDKNQLAAALQSNRLIVPEKWQKLLIEFSVRLMDLPQFADFPQSERIALVLQILLRALSAVGDEFQLEQLISKLYDVGLRPRAVKQEDGRVQDVIELRESTIFLLEDSISLASPTFLKERIFEDMFRSRIVELASLRSYNFAVQRFIDRIEDEGVLQQILEELEDKLEEILRIGHSGLVVSLANACTRLCGQQGRFVRLLLQALHCNEVSPEKILTAVLHLLPADVKMETTPRILLHGSLTLQALLRFNKPIKFVNSVLMTESDRLVSVLCDTSGSFIANAFVESRFVGEKSRDKLVRHLEGRYSQLMRTSHGSRVLEIVYQAANPAQQENIVRELAEEWTTLSNTCWGIAINKKLLVATYKRDPARWKASMKSDAKVNKMFNKLVGGGKRKAQYHE